MYTCYILLLHLAISSRAIISLHPSAIITSLHGFFYKLWLITIDEVVLFLRSPHRSLTSLLRSYEYIESLMLLGCFYLSSFLFPGRCNHTIEDFLLCYNMIQFYKGILVRTAELPLPSGSDPMNSNSELLFSFTVLIYYNNSLTY